MQCNYYVGALKEIPGILTQKRKENKQKTK